MIDIIRTAKSSRVEGEIYVKNLILLLLDHDLVSRTLRNDKDADCQAQQAEGSDIMRGRRRQRRESISGDDSGSK